MKHTLRFLARLYPSNWRKRYGPEFDALLEDTTPAGRDAFDVFWGALKMQMTTWTFGRITLACCLAGVLVSVAISFTWPVSYRSQAVLSVAPEGNGPATNQVMWHAVLTVEQRVLSTQSLIPIIQSRNLYMDERRRIPVDDVVDNMRKHILVRAISSPAPGNRVIPAFIVQFDYPDAHIAQQVTADLMARFIEANIVQNTTDEYLRAIHPQVDGRLNSHSRMRLEPLDMASLPTRPSRVNQTTAAAVGLFAGLLAGLTLAIVMRSRRRTAV